MSDPAPPAQIGTLVRSLFGEEAPAVDAFDENARLVVWGVHYVHRLELRLFFDEPAKSGIDRKMSFDSPEALVEEVQGEADNPGGYRYVVLPPRPNTKNEYEFARAFSLFQAADIFKRAEAHFAERVKRCADGMRQNTLTMFGLGEDGPNG